MKHIAALALLLGALFFATSASAQCSGQFPGGTACGNIGNGGKALPSPITLPPCANDGSHALVYVAGTGLVCETISAGSGTVTSVGSGACLTGGPISVSGTLAFTPSCIQSYLAGITLANDATTPNAVLDMSAGVATDSTNAVLMAVGAFTKSTGGAWTAGSGNNGMGNGLTFSASTWYYVCLANNGGTPDYWFDTSVSCANRPGGITDTKFRQVGAFKSDGLTHIIAFKMTGDTVIWNSPVQDYTTASAPTSPTAVALASVPSGIVVTALFRVLVFNTSVTTVLVANANEILAAANPIGNGTVTGITSTSQSVTGSAITNTSQQVNVSTTTSGATVDIVTYGYINYRGRYN